MPATTTSGSPPLATNAKRGALERKVALVRLHRRLDDAWRQLQEALVEAPLEHDRALDQEDDLLDHPGRVAPAADRIEPLEDLAAALVLVGLDPGSPQDLDVLVGARQLDLAAREAVPVGQVSGFEPGDRDLQRRLVELGAEPAHGA